MPSRFSSPATHQDFADRLSKVLDNGAQNIMGEKGDFFTAIKKVIAKQKLTTRQVAPQYYGFYCLNVRNVVFNQTIDERNQSTLLKIIDQFITDRLEQLGASLDVFEEYCEKVAVWMDESDGNKWMGPVGRLHWSYVLWNNPDSGVDRTTGKATMLNPRYAEITRSLGEAEGMLMFQIPIIESIAIGELTNKLMGF